MVAILPDNQGSIAADFDRRLRELENAQRSPIGGVGSGAFAPIVNHNPVLYDGLERTTALLSGVPVNLPAVTATGARFLVVCTFEMRDCGSDAAYAGQNPHVYCLVDTNPVIGLDWKPGGPGSTTYVAVSLVSGIIMAPGSHTFQMWWGVDANVGATTTKFRNATLVVVPVAQR